MKINISVDKDINGAKGTKKDLTIAVRRADQARVYKSDISDIKNISKIGITKVS